MKNVIIKALGIGILISLSACGKYSAQTGSQGNVDSSGNTSSSQDRLTQDQIVNLAENFLSVSSEKKLNNNESVSLINESNLSDIDTASTAYCKLKSTDENKYSSKFLPSIQLAFAQENLNPPVDLDCPIIETQTTESVNSFSSYSIYSCRVYYNPYSRPAGCYPVGINRVFYLCC